MDLALTAGRARERAYGKALLALGGMRQIGSRGQARLRVVTAAEFGSPQHRSLYVSALDPVETFEHHWWRPRGSVLKQHDVNGIPLGGAALRGYHWGLTTTGLAGANVDLSRQLGSIDGPSMTLRWTAHLFGDAAHVKGFSASGELLSDAGVGIGVAGRIFDRPLSLRLDSPVWLSHPAFGLQKGGASRERLAPRWLLVFRDVWPE